MRIEFTEKSYKISDKLKEIITKKISKLEKYFGDDALARVVCKVDNKSHKLEVTITNKGLMYRAEVVGENMYENIDFALPKIERQIIKQYEKKRDKFRDFVIDYSDLAFLDEKPEIVDKGIIKKKSFDLDPITVEEARDYMSAIDHDFYVFLNAETGKVNILYSRKDDRLGLIECNF
jgi:putative sigma-54 modulation protein